MSAAPLVARDGDRHLSPSAYRALAVLAALIGLGASYVTIRLFVLAIQQGETDGPARELLTLAAVLFVAAELAACFIAGLVPVHRLRTLRWQLTACAVVLLAFEAVSIYGARVTLVHAADARAGAVEGRAHQLRASIEANRRSAAALIEAGQRSSQSAIASSRADGAQSIRQAAALEVGTARMVAELADLEAARTPTTTTVFGESGVIVLAIVQSLLISSIGLLFLGAAGALARAARDAQATAPLHSTASASALADAPQRALVAVQQFQLAPTGTVAAVPHWGRSALAASAGLMTLATAPAHALEIPEPATTAPATASVRDTRSEQDGDARFLRVKEGIETGRIRPSIRSIYAAEGASQTVATRYLLALEQAGVIKRVGRRYVLRAAPAPDASGGAIGLPLRYQVARLMPSASQGLGRINDPAR